MTHASLFSGIGGAELAARWVGWKNVFHCEINPFGRRVIEYHFPESKSYEDVTTTDFSEYRGRIDVLTAGFPCQPFSVAGQRKGAEDNRYLWPEVVRVIREVRPTWVVGENVAGILTMVQPGEETEMGGQTNLFGEVDRKRILLRQEYVVETICGDLEREGYSVQPFIIPACAVGAPHRRDRVWFVANRTDRRDIDTSKRKRTNLHEGKSFARSDREGTSSDTDGIRFGRRQNKQESISWSKSAANYSVSRQNGVIADTKCDRSNKICENVQSKISNGKRIDSNGLQWNDTLCQSIPADRWKDFPTQSPVCSGDDELSTRLDGITFSKWRQESIKAYGNAWVPAVAYEIFKAIQQAEEEMKNYNIKNHGNGKQDSERLQRV